MKKQFLEAGQIVNTHGIRGEVRIIPWADGPEFLLDIDTFYVDGKAMRFTDVRVHKTGLIAKPEGIDNVNDAALLKGKTISISRDDIDLEPGRMFVADLIGLDAIDAVTGESFGKVSDVINLPSNDVYVVKGDREYMIPAVKEYHLGTDLEAGTMTFRLIEGMATNED